MKVRIGAGVGVHVRADLEEDCSASRDGAGAATTEDARSGNAWKEPDLIVGLSDGAIGARLVDEWIVRHRQPLDPLRFPLGPRGEARTTHALIGESGGTRILLN